MQKERGGAAPHILLVVVVIAGIVTAITIPIVKAEGARTKYTTICTVIQTGPQSYKVQTADSGSYDFDKSLTHQEGVDLYHQLRLQSPGTFKITWYWHAILTNTMSKASLLPADQQRRDLCPKP